jgi:predicted transcriptional regulator YheO
VVRQPLDPRMTPLLPLVQGLAEMFGSDCEVVLHDVGRLPHSIVAIENGHVTGRTVGDVPTDLMLRSLRQAPEGGPDVRLYVTSSDGKVLKSLAVTLRDADGSVYGILGLNFDVSGIVQSQRTLANLAAVGRLGGEAAPSEEIFAGDIRAVVAGMVAKILNEMGKTPAAMSRDEKMEVVKRLEERGAFLVKRSAEQIADALDLSRYTIFSYLKEIRRPGDVAPVGPQAVTSAKAGGDR